MNTTEKEANVGACVGLILSLITIILLCSLIEWYIVLIVASIFMNTGQYLEQVDVHRKLNEDIVESQLRINRTKKEIINMLKEANEKED